MTTSFVPDSPYQALLQSPGGIANTRITLVSGQPVMTSSVFGANQVIITPYLGSRLPIFNPIDGVWRYELFNESLVTLTNGTGAQQVTTNSNYDIYCYLSSSNGVARPLFALSAAWSSDTVVGSNPGGAERFAANGMLLNRWNIPNGPPPMRGTLIGTIRTNATNTVDYNFGGVGTSDAWSTASFGVSNYFNRLRVTTLIAATTATWLNSSNIFRPANSQSTARINFLRCIDEDLIEARYQVFSLITGAANSAVTHGVGLDQTTSITGVAAVTLSAATGSTVAVATAGNLVTLPGIGFHFVSANERVSAGTSVCNGWAANAPIGLSYTGVS